METYFTHLHLHTDHSLLDGAITIDRLVSFGQEHNMKSLAISDHGNIFGAVRFFDTCKKAGIKPVLGMEAYITEDMHQKTRDTPHYHLLLLVKNTTGYHNLCKLIYYSYTQGFYFKPRIDYATLKEHSEGLIATSTCLGGHVPQLFLSGQDEQAYQMIDRMLSIFGEDRYFLEVQPSDGRHEQKMVNEKILQLSQEKGLLTFASGDCHYPTVEDKYAHEVMLAIQTRAKMSDTNRMSLADCHIHMRTPQEMLDAFPDNQDVVYNSGYIADLCEFDFDKDKLFFPKFTIPQEHDEETYLRELCSQGLRYRIDAGYIPEGTDHQQYWDRLDHEIQLISRMGYVTYFLIVSDFIGWAKQNEIPVGPGRGSAAGSLVAWALDITDVDPIRYNLLFERFLNPERVNMPDIDIDFCMEERERIIEHVKEKYGHDKVCQIITFGTMMAKGVVKDVARALGIPFEEANAITELIPDEAKSSLQDALEQEPKLEEKRQSDPRIAQLFDVAFRIEGLTRHASKHAAGLVITPEPIHDMLPIYIPSKTNEVVTQYPFNELESLGFLKMDFLGLKNLTLIKRVVQLIKHNYGVNIDPSLLPLDDPQPYELISNGNTTGIFQLESSGIRDVLRRLRPEAFEDIIAVNALYRPGPLGAGMTESFIERRHGREDVSYLMPELEEVLKETYGVILYQEQVMQIASRIADYSLGEADMLRRAMGKKKKDVMDQHRAMFIERATTKGFDQNKVEELFDLMAYFAGYGFNKSHSTAYGKIAYQTAYLKSHYPAEFMASLISLEVDDTEKMGFYLQEVKDMEIDVLPPDINASDIDFTTEGNAIRFGLRGIKNVGTAALQHCLAERRENGPFQDILDFCTRVDVRTCNRRTIETLIAVGAFDQLPGNRAQQTQALDTVIDIAMEKKRAAATGQMALFDVSGPSNDNADTMPSYTFDNIDDWDDSTKLSKEKELLGVYLTARPLDRYRDQMSWLGCIPFQNAQHQEGTVIGCGTLKQYKEITTKKGDRMAFVTLEDDDTAAEIVVFPNVYSNVQEYLEHYSVFVVKGQIDQNVNGCKVKAQFFMPIDVVFDEWTGIQHITLTLPGESTESTIHELHSTMIPGPTPCHIQFTENNDTLVAMPKTKVFCDIDSLKQLYQHGISITCSLE